MSEKDFYLVQRHGGQSRHCWRTVATFTSRDLAWACCGIKANGMRQGGIRIIDPEGNVIRQEMAPRNRTAW